MIRHLLLLAALFSAPASAQVNARQVAVDGAGRLDQVIAADRATLAGKANASTVTSALASKADAAATATAIAARAPLDSPALTGAPTAPTPAMTSSRNSTRLANIALLRAFVGGSDLRTYEDWSSADIRKALDACIADLNANIANVCTGPEGPMTLATAPTVPITCTDCGFDFRRSTINVSAAAASAPVIFRLGTTATPTARFNVRGKLRISFTTPPPAGSYLFDFVNTSQVDLTGVEANNVAGIARFGSDTTNATQSVLRSWRVTLGPGAPTTDQFLLQSGGNTLFDDINVTGGQVCSDDEHGFWAVRMAFDRSVDTVRIVNSGAQCFTRGYDDDGNSTGVQDGKSYGLIIDTTRGGKAAYNIWLIGSFLDHTTKCNVMLRTAPGDVAKVRNVFFIASRLTSDAGSNFCLHNTGNVMVRGFEIRDGRAAIAGAGPHIDISGGGYLGASIHGLHLADSNPGTPKPVGIRLASDGWHISNNDFASAIAGASGVRTAIEVANPDITIARISDNFAPQAEMLLKQPPSYTTAVAPNRQIEP